jgi:hypothetical protein
MPRCMAQLPNHGADHSRVVLAPCWWDGSSPRQCWATIIEPLVQLYGQKDVSVGGSGRRCDRFSALSQERHGQRAVAGKGCNVDGLPAACRGLRGWPVERLTCAEP